MYYITHIVSILFKTIHPCYNIKATLKVLDSFTKLNILSIITLSIHISKRSCYFEISFIQKLSHV